MVLDKERQLVHLENLMENYSLAVEVVVVAIHLLFLLQTAALAAEETAAAQTTHMKLLLAKKTQVAVAVAFSTMRQIFFAILVLVAPELFSSVLHKEV